MNKEDIETATEKILKLKELIIQKDLEGFIDYFYTNKSIIHNSVVENSFLEHKLSRLLESALNEFIK